jgi:adenylate cyclase
LKLLPKASLIISLTLLLVLSLFYLIMNHILLEKYTALESMDIQGDLERILDAIRYEIKINNNKLGDWAIWNETYQFIQDHNQDYIDNNLSNDEMVTLGINVMVFIDNNKKIVITRTHSPNSNWQVNELIEYIKNSPNLLSHAFKESSVYGLVALSNNLLILASRPILRNDKTGPIMGTLLFGKFFNATLSRAITQRLRLNIRFYSFTEAHQHANLQSTLAALATSSHPFWVSPKNKQLVEGFTWFYDLTNQPSLLIHLSKDRPIYQQGLQLINRFLIALTLAGSLFLGISLLLIRQLVLSRLFQLVKDVQIITHSGDVSQRVQVVGQDELAILSQEINAMLDSLEDKSQALAFEKEKTESLLHNILPVPIAQRMKQGETMIAEHFDNVTILFSDIVGFTQWAAHTTPAKLVEILNRIFSEFDLIADRYGLEKIKTIGDAYMVVAGVPKPCELHIEIMALMALEMRDKVIELNKLFNFDISIRIGISTGEVIAGIIGKRKFAYDLWGDVVNTAARMESHGVAGKIQCTETIYQLLQPTFEFESRGLIEVKGKGSMQTYFLVGKKSWASSPPANELICSNKLLSKVTPVSSA